MSKRTEVAIIGAGPFGLSIASQLGAREVDHRIIGEPMRFWNTQMPLGMSLKSDGFASNLVDAQGVLSLKEFCRESGLPYADEGTPIALSTFIAYGRAFQKRMVPQLEEKRVTRLAAYDEGFALTMQDGETLKARKVVVATGIGDYAFTPRNLRNLPPELVSHSAQHRDVSAFAGRDITLVGGGSSAVDLAVLMHEQGAHVRVIVRDHVQFHLRTPLHERPLWQQLAHPHTGISPGWKALFYTRCPGLFRFLPESRRRHIVRTTCGPAGGWFMKDRFEGRVPVHTGTTVERARPSNGQLQLTLVDAQMRRSHVLTDHLIACTGYRVDLRRSPWLAPDLLARVRQIDHSPELGAAFESSVPGLHFVGTASALSYGPMMRFVMGAGYTAHILARHLAAGTARRSSMVYTRSPA